MSEERKASPSGTRRQAIFNALVRSEIVYDYLAAFHKATRLTLKLLPAEIAAGATALGTQENSFCALVARTNAGRRACEKTQAVLLYRLSQNLALHQGQCFAGMTHLVAPITVGSEHVATLLAGQVFLRKPTSRHFDRVVRHLISFGLKTGLPRLRSTWFDTPVVSPEQFAACGRLLTVFAHFVGECADRWMIANCHDEPSYVARAKEFIQANAGSPVSLRDVAQHVHFSPQHFSKQFKKATGMPFSEYASRVRVERAKELLHDRSIGVKEAAYESGFRSISSFYRVFQKFAGVTPVQYQAKM